jgi:Domain of unknown function (DUF4157)
VSQREEQFEPAPPAHQPEPPALAPAAPVAAPSIGGGVPGVIALQQAAGNRAVSGLMSNRPPVQPRGGPGMDMPFSLESTGSGRPLDEPVRERLESTVGEDLSAVRVHEDGQAERASANAIAAGNDVHFAAGQYNPNTSAGFDLVAHEIAHVAQQRAGRTPASAAGRLHSDPGLEAEADAVATRARTASPGMAPATSKGGAQVATTPAVQPNPAAAAAFLGLSAEAWGVAANVVGIVGAVGGAAAGTYSAVQPGSNAVGSLVLPQGFMSNQDQQKLQQIAQFEIINMYVDRYLAAHPDVAEQLRNPGGGAPSGAPPGGRPAGRPGAGPQQQPPAPAAEGGGEARPTGGPTGSAIDEAVLNAVKTSVERALASRLENNVRTMTAEFMWGEDDTRAEGSVGGSGTEESVGVTGFLQYRNIQGSSITQNLTLSNDSKLAVGSVPGEGTEVKVRKFLGGSVGGRATWSAYDNLAVNVEGGAAQTAVGVGGAPKLIVRTHWYWGRWGPDSETWMQNEIVVGDDGRCTISCSREGTP